MCSHRCVYVCIKAILWRFLGNKQSFVLIHHFSPKHQGLTKNAERIPFLMKHLESRCIQCFETCIVYSHVCLLAFFFFFPAFPGTGHITNSQSLEEHEELCMLALPCLRAFIETFPRRAASDQKLHRVPEPVEKT